MRAVGGERRVGKVRGLEVARVSGTERVERWRRRRVKEVGGVGTAKWWGVWEEQ